MHLVVGLGNPGAKYARHRHNAGFMVVEELARRASATLAKSRFSGRAARARLGGEDALLLLPDTYMNRSGDSAGPAARYYKIPPDRIVVVHDELDLPVGTLRVKRGGGHGGHNGLRSLVPALGGGDFVRVRFGIGRPEDGRDVTGHVLSDFSRSEAADLAAWIDRAADAVETILREGTDAAMNRFNAAGDETR